MGSSFLYFVRLDGFTYELSSIIKQIELWRRATHYWSETAPGRCLAVDYQNIVADPALILAEMAAFCDLGAPTTAPAPVFDDRGCAAPYRQMMESHLSAEGAHG